MDFGIDRLIEMIEQRINRTVANAVLYVLTVAALVWGLQIIGSFAVKAFTYIHGLILYFQGAKAPHLSPSDVLVFVLDIGLLVLLYMVFLVSVTVVRRRISRGIKAQFVELDSIVTDCKAFSDKTHAELHETVETLRRETAAILARTKLSADKMLADARAEAKAATPLPQLPPDTESKKQP